MLVTNDPWLCAGHLFDIAIVTPVFRDGRLVALRRARSAMSRDIGGTKDVLNAREIYDEGLQIPPMKLYRAGVRERGRCSALIAQNVRDHDQVLGDSTPWSRPMRWAPSGCCASWTSTGCRTSRALAAVVQGRTEARPGRRSAPSPTASTGSEITCNPLGDKLRLPLEVTVKDDTMTLDYAGAPPQLPRGGLNCTLNYTAALHRLSAEMHPQPRTCGATPATTAPVGRRSPVRIHHSTACGRPRSASGIAWLVHGEPVLNALADAVPDAVKAFTGLPFVVLLVRQGAGRRSFSDMMFSGGGQGGEPPDGRQVRPALADLGGQHLDRVVREPHPVLVLEKSCRRYRRARPDPRRARPRMRFRKLDDDGVDLLAAVFPEGYDVEQPGTVRGRTGWTRGPDLDRGGRETENCGAGRMITVSDRRASSRCSWPAVRLRRPAGAPAGGDRGRSANGYVTAEGAARDYGYMNRLPGTAPRVPVAAEPA